VRSEKLVAEAGDSSGTHRKGNVRRWKPLPSNGYLRLRRLSVCCSYGGYLSETVVIICCYEYKCPINPITNPNPLHSQSRDNIYNSICGGHYSSISSNTALREVGGEGDSLHKFRQVKFKMVMRCALLAILKNRTSVGVNVSRRACKITFKKQNRKPDLYLTGPKAQPFQK
jgi:hypothetical protein